MLPNGELVLRIMERFAQFRGPKGEHFSRVLLRELLMGKLSEAWQAEIQTRANLQGSLDIANQTIQQLSSGSVKTPGGYVLDDADLATVDEMIGTVSGVPVPDPTVPPA